MSFGEHPAIPFAFGSLTGLRAFNLREDGCLQGINFTQHYHEGENLAYCGAERTDDDRGSVYHWEPETNHHVAVNWCSCGFYAYYNGSNDYWNSYRVTGIVQGYGKCTYGNQGFRAQKLEILAIINPFLTDKQVEEQAKRDTGKVDLSKPPIRDRFFGSRAYWWTLISTALFYISLTATMSIWMTDSILMTLVGIVLLVSSLVWLNLLLIWRRRWNRNASFLKLWQPNITLDEYGFGVNREKMVKVSRRYPNVPQYRSVNEALKVFPLTNYYKDTPGGRERKNRTGKIY